MKITIELQDTEANATSLLAFAERFKSMFIGARPMSATPQSQSPAPPHSEQGDSSVGKWFARLGQGSRSFWVRAAQFSQEHDSWTFEQLAGDETKPAVLRSYHRNSYRAINVENAADPLVKQWDASQGCYVYFLAPEIRDEILRLAGQE
jgi:hypothetical protein